MARSSTNDRFVFTNEYSDYAGNAGHDTAVSDANGGTDTVNASAVGSNSIIRLDGATGSIDGVAVTFSNIENAIGGDANDILVGNSGANQLWGMRGNDTLNGGGGNDALRGGSGNDIFIIDTKLDQVIERRGQGTDTVQSSVTFTLGSNIENGLVIGTLARDLTGNGLANTLTGNGAANVLSGAAGNDTLNGGGGVDRLVGALGRDQMTGGADRDIFDFNAFAETGNSSTTCDTIKDFRHLIDDIDVSTIDASTLLSGNNAFVWKGTGAFTTSSAGELRFKLFDNPGTANDYTIIYGDTDKDTASEFQIHLKGLVLLTSSDFIL